MTADGGRPDDRRERQPDGEPAAAPPAPVEPAEPAEPAEPIETDAPIETDEERRARRRRLAFLLTPYGMAVVAGIVARAFFPALAARHPLVLIALDARNLHLVLAAEAVSPEAFFLVATIRLLAVDPFMYLIGRWYGDTGLRWVERRLTSLQPTIEWLEKFFKKAAPLAVAAFPGPVICTLAGATGMRVASFLAFNLTGTLVRITLIWWVGDVFSGPLGAVRDFFDRYIVWTTAASVVLVAIWLTLERRGGSADTESPLDLADELEAEIEREEHGGPGAV